MAQEAIDTVHTPSKTSKYQMAEDDETDLFRSMHFMIASGDRTHPSSCSDPFVAERGQNIGGTLVAHCVRLGSDLRGRRAYDRNGASGGYESGPMLYLTA